jgi:hypothetical protein
MGACLGADLRALRVRQASEALRAKQLGKATRAFEESSAVLEQGIAACIRSMEACSIQAEECAKQAAATQDANRLHVLNGQGMALVHKIDMFKRSIDKNRDILAAVEQRYQDRVNNSMQMHVVEITAEGASDSKDVGIAIKGADRLETEDEELAGASDEIKRATAQVEHDMATGEDSEERIATSDAWQAMVIKHVPVKREIAIAAPKNAKGYAAVSSVELMRR